DRVRHIDRQRAAGKGHALADEARAELGEKPVVAPRRPGLLDKPGERRWQLHGSNHGLGRFHCPSAPCALTRVPRYALIIENRLRCRPCNRGEWRWTNPSWSGVRRKSLHRLPPFSRS